MTLVPLAIALTDLSLLSAPAYRGGLAATMRCSADVIMIAIVDTYNALIPGPIGRLSQRNVPTHGHRSAVILLVTAVEVAATTSMVFKVS